MATNIHQNQSNNNTIEVVIVPFPAHSHLNRLFQLSHIISSYNTKTNPISVHFIASSLHNSHLNSLNPNPNPNTIHFHEFPNPSPPFEFDVQTPQHVQQLPQNPNFPSHLDAYFEAYVELLRPHVATLLATLCGTRRVVVIHDTLTSSAVQDSLSFQNVETFVFHCISGISCLSFLLSIMGVESQKFPSSKGCFSPRFEAFLASQFHFLRNVNQTAGVIHNTSRVIETQFLHLLSENRKCSNVVWAVGPLDRLTMFKNGRDGKGKYLEWLDKQEQNSVLYICFGTTTIMKDDQIKELALGLEQSGTKFIWVLNVDGDKLKDFSNRDEALSLSKLPLGFEERMKENGMGIVVREWAPQLEILGHPSTGGFMSHCGWNSCLESLSLGVPIIVWPMHSDQPMNATLITDILKAGLVVREWEKRDELVNSSTIVEVVKRLIKSKEGDEMRMRTENLGSELRKSTEERLELDSFVAHLTRI